MRPLWIGILTGLLGAGAASGAGAPPGAHGALACRECHPEAEEQHVPCEACHRTSTHVHPTRVSAPSFSIPEPFPTTAGGMTCATCHRVHEPTGPSSLRVSAGRGGADDLCVACHAEGLLGENPHEGGEGTRRCAFCHAALDVAAVLRGQRLAPRLRSERLCTFCHRGRGADHPRNLDPTLRLPRGLPRGPEGEVTCVSCHDPHGSSDYTHYVRDAYARHFQREREANPHVDDRLACPSCHTEESPERISAAADLRFQGDAAMLCISCHTRSRSHHPVGTPLPEPMFERLEARGGLPLDQGRPTCITCHTNNCATGEQHMSVRQYDPRRMDLSLCWLCHPREEFAETNPHRKNVDETTEGCIFCHDRKPVKGLEEPGRLYFISDVKMICLRCHEDLSDSDASHMAKVPSEEIRSRMREVSENRDLDFPVGRDGRLSCTTCHNAHFSTEAAHRTRLPAAEMCSVCHRR